MITDSMALKMNDLFINGSGNDGILLNGVSGLEMIESISSHHYGYGLKVVGSDNILINYNIFTDNHLGGILAQDLSMDLVSVHAQLNSWGSVIAPGAS